MSRIGDWLVPATQLGKPLSSPAAEEADIELSFRKSTVGSFDEEKSGEGSPFTGEADTIREFLKEHRRWKTLSPEHVSQLLSDLEVLSSSSHNMEHHVRPACNACLPMTALDLRVPLICWAVVVNNSVIPLFVTFLRCTTCWMCSASDKVN